MATLDVIQPTEPVTRKESEPIIGRSLARSALFISFFAAAAADAARSAGFGLLCAVDRSQSTPETRKQQ